MKLPCVKFVLVTVVLVVLLTDDSDAWLWRSRRRRRSCSARNCRWGGWSSWSSCSRTCGSSGTQRRTRGVAVSASCGGSGCSGASSETRACNRYPPRNCNWGSWSSWSACSATCGNSGTRRRTRSISRAAYCGGSGCSGSTSQTQACNRSPPRNCQWQNWGPWSACTATCGNSGLRTRTRGKAVEAFCGGVRCSGNSYDQEACNRFPQRNCQWGSWGSWNSCSATCGNSGTQTRTRSYAVTAYCGGALCSGSNRDTQACNRSPPRNCRWTDWGSWGTCTAPCGNTGTRARTRSIAEAAFCGGTGCSGGSSETGSCNRHCPHGAPAGPRCNCAGTGYTGTCCDNDIDECTSGTDHCHQHATCTNTVGSYRCECDSGYTGDGRTCTALCWASTTCPHGGICSSPDHCSRCDSGYESPDCGNIDECAADANCHVHASCSDTDGSFTCTCSDGYSGSGLHCERNAPSLVSCPATTRITVNSPDGGILTWTNPEFRFQPSNELANHECSANKGDAAPIGTHNIQCWAEGFADENTCDFDVIIKAPVCVIPPRPLNGAVTCGVADGYQKFCSVSCQNTYEFAERPADAYRCDWNATWHPSEDLPWPDCSRAYRPGRVRQKNELYYYTGSCAFNEEDIKRDFLRLYATLGDCSAGISCGVADIEVSCEQSRKRRNTPTEEELMREHNVDIVVKRSTQQSTVKITFVTEAETLADEPTASDQSELVGALDNIYFELRARVAARTFNLDIGGESVEAANYVGLLPTFDLDCQEGQIEKVEAFGAVCINCPVGTHVEDNTCVRCPPGWYQDEEAQTECKACPHEGSSIEGCGEEPDHCHFNPCLNGGTCHDLVGGYNCTCPDSFTGTNCEQDVDECDQGIDTCPDDATCANTPGGYNCTCGQGYTGDGHSCNDDDECYLQIDNCDEHSTCANTPGTYTCSCMQGYTGDGHICTDKDECSLQTDNCDVHATCTNTPGTYTCACIQGYTGDGHTCTDKDECALGEDNCDEYATCTNTPGTYTCACIQGYTGDGRTCTDKDECSLQMDNCDVHATCANTPGTYTCACIQGYTGDGRTCTDKDECVRGEDNCDVHATCTNTPGTYTCACIQGYSGDGRTCTDKDECARGEDTCDVHATCTNTPGTYTCGCDEGYTGNGFTCIDTDECALGQDNCVVHAACANTPGSYTCVCAEGYTGNGLICIDKNECTQGQHNCDEHATCTNTPGSYSCVCKKGYTGDGHTCTVSCPTGFELWTGDCYYYSSRRKNFRGAESDCDARGARLVVVPNSATHQYLVTKAKANGNSGNIWIGLSDIIREGSFIWSNGVPLGSFHPWIGRNNARADCVQMKRSRSGYRWRVRVCRAKFNYFCQKAG
ncbi:fibrillin-2-like [Branchiostoma lanceolatum]|uniref:fibrillin-2-like n=1 Tax=Branchiostoma lanceolatum TaxID=7740 RepID=UPI0034550877